MGGAKKIIAIIFIVIVACAVCFYVINDGIVNLVTEFFRTLAQNAVELLYNTWSKIKGFLGISSVKDGMNIYCIKEENVQTLKEQIEAQKVDTDKAGITNIMLKKILLAYAVTSSTQDTLCVVETTEEEILKGTKYDSLDDYFADCNKKSSKDKWQIDTVDYDLYYFTKSFFYFYDEDNIVQLGENKLLLGINGTIEIETEEGDAFSYLDRTNFDLVKTEFLALKAQDKADEENETRKKLLTCYTINDGGEMAVYKLNSTVNEYDYNFENDNIDNIDKNGVDEDDSVFTVEEVPLAIDSNIDTSSYTLSVELLMGFLDFTGSPQYVDEFIDFAMDKSKVKVKAYMTENKRITYSKKEYEIKDDFIFELYDMINGTVDVNSDNMSVYKPLIFERIHDGNPFDGSIVDLDDYDKIIGEGSVDYIYKYLLSAYDPTSDFDLGDIKVKEVIEHEEYENSHQFLISSITTWYGNIKYPTLSKEYYYTINDIECTRDEYNDFNENDITSFIDMGDITVKKIFVDDANSEIIRAEKEL